MLRLSAWPRTGCWVGLLAALTAVVLLASPPNLSADQIFFSKSFPGSSPPYFEVLLDSMGQASYREDDEEAVEFRITPEEARRLFQLAEKLDRFRAPIASNKKVAFTGEKTLRFVGGSGDRMEVQFNYSQNGDANAIVEWFEKVGETQRHRMELERAVQFDRLGVNKALLQFQAALERGRIVGRRQFLPVLGKIAEGQKYLHISRARAASLVERIELEGR